MPRKKHRHRADGEHFSLDIPFNRTLLLPVVFSTRAPVPFLHVADFKGIRRGWDLRDTQLLGCVVGVAVSWIMSKVWPISYPKPNPSPPKNPA
jgi:hypothetical protein